MGDERMFADIKEFQILLCKFKDHCGAIDIPIVRNVCVAYFECRNCSGKKTSVKKARTLI